VKTSPPRSPCLFAAPDRRSRRLGAKWQQQQAPYLNTFIQLRGPRGRKASCADCQGRGILARRRAKPTGTGRSLASLLSMLCRSGRPPLALVRRLLASQALRAKLAARPVPGELARRCWQGKRTVFHLISEVARTVEDLAPSIRISTASASSDCPRCTARHMRSLEASLDEVVISRGGDKISRPRHRGIFQTNSCNDLISTVERAGRPMGRKPGPFRGMGKARQSRRECALTDRPDRQRTCLGGLDPNNALLEIETAFAEAAGKKPSRGSGC